MAVAVAEAVTVPRSESSTAIVSLAPSLEDLHAQWDQTYLRISYIVANLAGPPRMGLGDSDHKMSGPSPKAAQHEDSLPDGPGAPIIPRLTSPLSSSNETRLEFPPLHPPPEETQGSARNMSAPWPGSSASTTARKKRQILCWSKEVADEGDGTFCACSTTVQKDPSVIEYSRIPGPPHMVFSVGGLVITSAYIAAYTCSPGSPYPNANLTPKRSKEEPAELSGEGPTKRTKEGRHDAPAQGIHHAATFQKDSHATTVPTSLPSLFAGATTLGCSSSTTPQASAPVSPTLNPLDTTHASVCLMCSRPIEALFDSDGSTEPSGTLRTLKNMASLKSLKSAKLLDGKGGPQGLSDDCKKKKSGGSLSLRRMLQRRPKGQDGDDDDETLGDEGAKNDVSGTGRRKSKSSAVTTSDSGFVRKTSMYHVEGFSDGGGSSFGDDSDDADPNDRSDPRRQLLHSRGLKGEILGRKVESDARLQRASDLLRRHRAKEAPAAAHPDMLGDPILPLPDLRPVREQRDEHVRNISERLCIDPDDTDKAYKEAQRRHSKYEGG